MSKFVIECPKCGKYAEANSGLFGIFGKTKKVNCSCGNVIDIRTDKLTSRTCPHCGNDVVFDQSEGSAAKCPVCGEHINTLAEQDRTVEFSCKQCGIRLRSAKTARTYTCPVCEFENDVAERTASEKIKHDGLANVIKYEGDAEALVWKHPIEDFNYGSQLIVHESQEAIFFRDGQALDLFGAGRYTLETAQLPILEKLYKLPTDGDNTFHSEVYFFNISNHLGFKWGTPEKVTLIDPLTQAPISLGARGTLNLVIADSRKLLLKLVGTGVGLTRSDLLEGGNSHIQEHFSSIIQLAVSTHMAQIITEEKLDLLQLDQQKLRISAALLPVIQPYFEAYGLSVTEFLLLGIRLPQKGELGYDALQTIIRLRQTNLTKSAIEVETEIKLAEMEAKKQLDIRFQQNAAEVEAAHRSLVAQKGETTVLEAQLEGQRKVAEASGDVAAERLRMQLDLERKAQMAQIEAEEMRLKGYTQRDVLQADVMKAFAEHPGEGGSAMGGFMGDAMRMGTGFAAMGAAMGMAKDAMSTGLNAGQTLGQEATATGWDCPNCGKKHISFNFCPDCGTKKPEPKIGWDCPACGEKNITSNFCPHCGAKRPEGPKDWTCPECGTVDITSNYCPNCGHKKPADTWICPDCGQADIKTKCCPNCGHKKGE